LPNFERRQKTKSSPDNQNGKNESEIRKIVCDNIAENLLKLRKKRLEFESEKLKSYSRIREKDNRSPVMREITENGEREERRQSPTKSRPSSTSPTTSFYERSPSSARSSSQVRCTHTHTHTCIHTYTHSLTHTHTHTHMHIHTHTHTHTHKHTHTH
jgi:hypothetical protein